MPDGRRDDVSVVLEVIFLFNELGHAGAFAEHSGEVSGNTGLFGNNKSLHERWAGTAGK